MPIMQAEVITSHPCGPFELKVFHVRLEHGRLHVGAVFSAPTEFRRIDSSVVATTNAGTIDIRNGGFLSERGRVSSPPFVCRRFVDCFVRIPPDCKSFKLTFEVADHHKKACNCPVVYSTTAPLSEKTPDSYLSEGGWIVRPMPTNGITACRATPFRRIMAELRYDRWLLFRQRSKRAMSVIPLRWVVLLLRPIFLRLHIWLLSDRPGTAGDNGEALFRYLIVRQKKCHCRPVFVLDRNSSDWKHLRSIGPVLPFSPLLMRLAVLVSEWTVSSQPHPAVWFKPLQRNADGYRGLANDHRFAFLQHGVIKDDMSHVISRNDLDFDLFITTASRERFSIVDTPAYGYSGETVVLSGLPRHDRLENRTEKLLTFMPTWRQYLCSGKNAKTGEWILAKGFENSNFVTHLRAALSSSKLLNAAECLGYRIQFLPHPLLASGVSLLSFDPRIRILSSGTAYRDVFAESAVCITDWSSSVFDFAWLGKPVVYYQPEDDRHYIDGYFDYEKDGFGPVTHSANELVDILVLMMERGCRMEEPYRTRAASFFAFHDQNNCRRVFDAIQAASRSFDDKGMFQ